jgi:cysteine desulfurase
MKKTEDSMKAYLDNAATTRVRQEAAEAVMHAMRDTYANPSSLHAAGLDAHDLVETSRSVIASALGAQPGEIFFTSGGTEADNWALSAAYSRRYRHIVSTAVEHEAVLNKLKAMSDLGWEITLVAPERDGSISAEKVAAAVREDTALVSVMTVNNETGNIYPIAEIARLIKGSRALLHTDAVQAFMKQPLRADRLGADLISVSAHKIHGPKGIGALYIKKGTNVKPLIFGGGQERGLRSGTENVPAIAGFAAAVKAAGKRDISLRSSIVERLASTLPEAVVIGGGSEHILCLSLPGLRSETVMNYLSAKGVFVSRGSACAKGRRSHVLEAMRLPPDVIDGSIRASFSEFTTEAEAEYFCACLEEAAQKLLKKL